MYAFRVMVKNSNNQTNLKQIRFFPSITWPRWNPCQRLLGRIEKPPLQPVLGMRVPEALDIVENKPSQWDDNQNDERDGHEENGGFREAAQRFVVIGVAGLAECEQPGVFVRGEHELHEGVGLARTWAQGTVQVFAQDYCKPKVFIFSVNSWKLLFCKP